MTVLISMLVGSKLSTKSLVEKSISSILLNIGTEDFLLLIGISSNIKPDIIKSIERIRLENPDNVIVITEPCSSFAKFHNYVFLKYGSESKWVIVAHDDIELKTKDLINKIKDVVNPFTDIGWVNFTDDYYLYSDELYLSLSYPTRPGFYYDYVYEEAWKRRKLFQFHLLEENYWKKVKDSSYSSNLNYDFPNSVVRCHAPWSHFIAIESEKLRRIGLWEDWSTSSLCADEDMGLIALQEGLRNIWIPNIVYSHIREVGTRSYPLIAKERKQAHESFIKKWGFLQAISKDDLIIIIKKYKNTNIGWSLDRKSFEWDYLK